MHYKISSSEPTWHTFPLYVLNDTSIRIRQQILCSINKNNKRITVYNLLQLLLFTYFTTNKNSNENTFKNLKIVGQFIERITFTFVLTLAICIKVDERFNVRHNQSKTGMSKWIYKVNRYIYLIHRTLNTHIATLCLYIATTCLVFNTL